MAKQFPPTSIRIPAELKEKIRQAAESNDPPISEHALILAILAQWVRAKEAQTGAS